MVGFLHQAVLWAVAGIMAVGTVWLWSQAVRNWRSRQSKEIPDGGFLTCPFCSDLIARHALYRGQKVNCPNCCAEFHAPLAGNPSRNPVYRESMWRLFFAVVVFAVTLLYAVWAWLL